MLNTIGIKEEKIEIAVMELKNLWERLDEISLGSGKEEGDCGATSEMAEACEIEAEATVEAMKELINVTVTFLNGVKETVKTMDKKAGQRMERVV